MTDFSSLGIGASLNRALTEERITLPTPIQAETIPLVLEGHDVIAEAQTGTGKTLAFILPILQRIKVDKPHIQALIVTPTRELALQITTEIKKTTRFMPEVNVLAVYGGQDVAKQIKRLEGARQVVVGTPGRIIDHLRRGTIDLSQVSTVVLDEADQMLHFGFLQDVETILREMSSDKQTLLFSATMPNQIRTLANRYLRKPKHIRIKTKQITVDAVKQLIVETSDRLKQDSLKRCIDEYRPYLAMIFCRTKRRAKTLNEALQKQGYEVDELHGDLSQAQREAVIKRFRNAQIQLLVATDVAARGLDIEAVTHVFNYDIPHDVESYIHRIGRTGRAGERGVAVTFVAPKDLQHLRLIEKGIQQTIERKDSQPKTERRERNELTRGDGRSRGDRSPRRESRTSKDGGSSSSTRSGSRSSSRSSSSPSSRSNSRSRDFGTDNNPRRSSGRRASDKPATASRKESDQRGRSSRTSRARRGR